MLIKIIDAMPYPLTFMGEVASVCYNSKPSKQVGLDCIVSGHDRVLEFVDLTIEISGYSARMVRELYTHIVGVSRLQQSTRYVNYEDFQYYVPLAVRKDMELLNTYHDCMLYISHAYHKLVSNGISKEDAANLLPLGMMTKVVLKINARALIHLAHVRMCNRAYQEFRDFMNELKDTVSKIDEEWQIISDFMKPKCFHLGYCPEKNSCGQFLQKVSEKR